jgi:hemerythrin
MMEFVNWDDEIPNIWKVIRFMFETTNQWFLSHTAYLDTNTHEFL